MGVYNSESLEPIVTKFGVGDYFGDMTPHAKIQRVHPSGVSQQMSEILFSRGF